MGSRRSPLLALALALTALPALADEDPLAPPPEGTRRAAPADERPARRQTSGDAALGRVLNLANRIGLSGFGDLIDARVPPQTIAVRGGLRYRLQLVDERVQSASHDVERHEFPLYAGASLFGLLDGGLRASYVFREEDIDVRGGLDTFREEQDEGWADMELGAKAALDLSPFAVGAYVQGLVPTDTEVTRLADLDLGVTGTFALWDDRIAVHGNLGGKFIEEGTQALRYRVGASFVPLASDFLTLRVYGYADGLEYEGAADSEVDLEFGAQAILFGFITAEVGFGVRVFDSGYVDRDLRKALASQGLFDESTDDRGTWEFDLGAGLAFSF